MEKVTNIILILVFSGVFILVGYINYKCWNIPLYERSDVCAMLHQK